MVPPTNPYMCNFFGDFRTVSDKPDCPTRIPPKGSCWEYTEPNKCDVVPAPQSLYPVPPAAQNASSSKSIVNKSASI